MAIEIGALSIPIGTVTHMQVSQQGVRNWTILLICEKGAMGNPKKTFLDIHLPTLEKTAILVREILKNTDTYFLAVTSITSKVLEGSANIKMTFSTAENASAFGTFAAPLYFRNWGLRINEKQVELSAVGKRALLQKSANQGLTNVSRHTSRPIFPKVPAKKGAYPYYRISEQGVLKATRAFFEDGPFDKSSGAAILEKLPKITPGQTELAKEFLGNLHKILSKKLFEKSLRIIEFFQNENTPFSNEVELELFFNLLCSVRPLNVPSHLEELVTTQEEEVRDATRLFLEQLTKETDA